MNTEKVIDHIIDWLKKYVSKSGMNGFVVGVSGGVDSAVVSTLAAKTGYPVLCVEMPIHQAENQVNRAQEHILNLKKAFPNVTDIHVDLTPPFENLKAQFPKTEKTETYQLTLANTRSRLRMTTLYYFAGLHGFLVTGTGNKVEDFGVGFLTKYGDGGVDISPIADLYKTEVYELATVLGVAKNIRNAAPTDGLFGDSRTDEDQLGASYAELEWAMKMHAENKTENDFSGRELQVFRIYLQRHRANLHKINPIPVCKIPDELK